MNSATFLSLFAVCCCLTYVQAAGKYKGLEFIEPCSRKDPYFDVCLKKAANGLVTKFRQGFPQLGYTEVEPIILDELHIALGGGPDGYKAKFKNITAKGVSQVVVTGLESRVTNDEVQVRLNLSIPRINANAKYRSSGRLIVIQASGAGDYWGVYDDVNAVVYIKAKPYTVENRQYLRLQQVKLNFAVKGLKMGVENIIGGNSLIHSALNLFINTNAQELLKEMKPDLRRKLVQVMSAFLEKMFSKVPYDAFVEA